MGFDLELLPISRINLPKYKDLFRKLYKIKGAN